MGLSTLGYNADRIAEIGEALFELSEEEMSAPRKEGAWSRKQILGHLCDSANVNQQRIIESVLSGSIVFTGYKHEEWVRLNGYQECEWEELVTLWCSMNMQLCAMIERIPAETLDALHDVHSYETTAFREISSDQPSTLGYLIEDYFAHLEYHLHQIQDI